MPQVEIPLTVQPREPDPLTAAVSDLPRACHSLEIHTGDEDGHHPGPPDG